MTDKLQACKDFAQGDGFKIHIQHNPQIDITGYSFRLVLKSEEDSPNSVLDVTYVIPGTEPAATQATTGEAFIPIPASATTGIAPGEYWATLKRIDTGSEPITLIRTGMAGAGLVTVFKNLG